MRHRNAGRKFGRNTSHRRAMLRNLTANLITHERIQTTDAKAKELRRVAERLVSKAIRLGEVAYTKAENVPDAEQRKARRLHVTRLLGRYIPRFGVAMEDGTPKRIDLIEKVMVELAQRYQGRPGGYTRIIKLGNRRGDNAPMSIIEFVEATKAEAPAVAETPAAETPAAP